MLFNTSFHFAYLPQRSSVLTEHKQLISSSCKRWQVITLLLSIMASIQQWHISGDIPYNHPLKLYIPHSLIWSHLIQTYYDSHDWVTNNDKRNKPECNNFHCWSAAVQSSCWCIMGLSREVPKLCPSSWWYAPAYEFYRCGWNTHEQQLLGTTDDLSLWWSPKDVVWQKVSSKSACTEDGGGRTSQRHCDWL